MQCGICFEKYNNEKNKPMAIIPCIHTVCLSCVKKLKKQICPNCKKEFIDTSPNWILLDLVQEASNEKLRSDTEIYLNNCTDLRKSIHEKHDKRLKEIDIKYKTIESEITNHANTIINSIELNRSKLLAQLDIMRLQETNDVNKFLIDKSFDNDLVNAKNFLQYNLSEAQLTRLKNDFSDRYHYLKLKLSDLQNLNENNFEFVAYKRTVDFDLGSIKVHVFKHKLKTESKTSHTYIEKAKEFENLKNYEHAIECYEKAIKLDKNNHKLYYLKGKCHEKLNDFRSSIKCYKEAFQIDPCNISYRNLIMHKRP